MLPGFSLRNSPIQREIPMSAARKVMMALATAVASATPGIAADGGLDDGMAWVLDPSGKTMVQMRFTAEGLRAFMAQNPKALGTRMFLVRSGGQFYCSTIPRAASTPSGAT
jgi:hypothetical protein